MELPQEGIQDEDGAESEHSEYIEESSAEQPDANVEEE